MMTTIEIESGADGGAERLEKINVNFNVLSAAARN